MGNTDSTRTGNPVMLELVVKKPYPWLRYVGTEPALRAAGFITNDDRLPQKMGGCSGSEGVKISRLADGRLRISLEANVGAARDRVLQRVIEDAKQAAGAD